MLIEGKKGRYILVKNYRNAFNLESFESKYIEECFDKYDYIVGDISSSILRLKGFDANPKSKNYFGFIEDYLDLSCAMGCPHYVLKRIKTESEYKKEIDHPSKVDEEGLVVEGVGKESFDKDALVLESSLRQTPNIIIDADRLNQIPKGELSAELRTAIEQDQYTSNNKVPEKAEPSQSYVSSSPGFVPNQNKNYYRKNNKNNNKKNKK